MQEQKARRDEYSTSHVMNASTSNTPTTSSALYSSPQKDLRQRNANMQPGVSQDTVIQIGGQQQDDSGFGFGNVQQNMQLMQNSVNMEIIESRSQAIESIESTIAELGQIYQHFAHILTSQREAIQRIDENVIDAEMNVEGAHGQLLRYYENISSNRWLMLKIFGAVIFFFLLYSMFLS